VLLAGCGRFLELEEVKLTPDAAPGVLVQRMAADTPSGDNLSVSLPVAPAPNDVLILIGGAENGIDSGPTGAMWKDAASSSTSPSVHVWYAVSDGTNPDVSVIAHSTSRMWLLETEWYGIATTGTVDSNDSNGKAGGPADSGMITLSAPTSVPDLVIVSITGYDQIGALPSEWTQLEPDITADAITQKTWYQVVDTPGTQSISTTFTNEWDAVMVGFRLGQ